MKGSPSGWQRTADFDVEMHLPTCDSSDMRSEMVEFILDWSFPGGLGGSQTSSIGSVHQVLSVRRIIS